MQARPASAWKDVREHSPAIEAPGRPCPRVWLGSAALCLGLLLGAAPGRGAEDPAQESAIHIGRLHYDGGGDWYSNPSSNPNWMRAFEQRTGIVTYHDEIEVRPGDNALYHYPLVYMNGHGNVSFTPEQAQYLRQWMQAGGFLWADDNYGMDKSFRREVKKIFPDRELVDLPNGHPIFRCFYRLPGLPKVHQHDGKPPECLAILGDGGRVQLLYTYESDIGDGIEDPGVHNDPPEKREQAMRMAVNIMIYALTH